MMRVARVTAAVAGTLVAWCALGTGTLPAQGTDRSVVRVEDPIARAASVSPSTPADLDSTTAPCEDFYQYATGGWYARPRSGTYPQGQVGTNIVRGDPPLPTTPVALALRQLVARAPALAPTSMEPALRAVGYFYGSCLADTSGAAQGIVGDTGRASFCFRTTRQYLDRALFELFLEHVWPPVAQAASRQFWPNIQAGIAARFRASRALSDGDRQRLAAVVEDLNAYVTRRTDQPRPTDTVVSLGMLWRSDSDGAAGGQRPAAVPFAGADVARTWVYRDYTDLALSPTAFGTNVARLRAAPDTVPPPVLSLPVEPGAKPILLMDEVFEAPGSAEGTNSSSNKISLAFADLVPPLVDGQLDFGVWYGRVAVLGHELGHHLDQAPLADAGPAVRAAFAAEQFQGQLPPDYGHEFQDMIGVLIVHDAFQRARQSLPMTSIDGLTPEQRFFLGVAWGYRYIWNKEDQGVSIVPVSQILGRSRLHMIVNGALSALPTFAQAFGCKAGDPMAGGNIWYQRPWYLALTAKQRDVLAQEYESYLKADVQAILDSGPGGKLTLTAEEETAFAQRRAGHAAQREALLGLPEQPARVGTPAQIFHLLGQELGELRMVLSAERRAIFDANAKAWLVNFGNSNPANFYPMEIPGVP